MALCAVVAGHTAPPRCWRCTTMTAHSCTSSSLLAPDTRAPSATYGSGLPGVEKPVDDGLWAVGPVWRRSCVVASVHLTSDWGSLGAWLCWAGRACAKSG